MHCGVELLSKANSIFSECAEKTSKKWSVKPMQDTQNIVQNRTNGHTLLLNSKQLTLFKGLCLFLQNWQKNGKKAFLISFATMYYAHCLFGREFRNCPKNNDSSVMNLRILISNSHLLRKTSLYRIYRSQYIQQPAHVLFTPLCIFNIEFTF